MNDTTTSAAAPASPNTAARKQVLLAAAIIGVNEHTLWEAPGAGSQTAFSSFKHLAQTAERGFFDYFFLAEGLAIRERNGRAFEHDIAGRPDTLTVLAALAAVTEHLGLVGTLSTTFNEPFELARQVASLDHLSGGRAGWNVVTSFDAFTGQNFRRGGYLPHELRYERAEEFVATMRTLWDSWAPDALAADAESGEFLRDGRAGEYALHSNQFDISGRFTVPRSPQGRPVIVQAGVSPRGREFAAANADVIFSPYVRLEEAQAFHRDINARALRAGRPAGSIKILPAVQFALGDTEAEARDKAQFVIEQQLSDTAIRVRFEQVWNRSFAEVDLDGPVPSVAAELDPEAPQIIQGRSLIHADRGATVREWQALAAERGLSVRGLAHEVLAQGHEFVGTPSQVAQRLDEFVQADGSDGFVFSPEVVPTGLDEFVDRVVPILQERGALRTAYEGTTLRENLGLPVPAWEGAGVAAG